MAACGADGEAGWHGAQPAEGGWDGAGDPGGGDAVGGDAVDCLLTHWSKLCVSGTQRANKNRT